MILDPAVLRRLAEEALREDRAGDDITTAALVPTEQRGRAIIIAKAEGVLAGLPVAEAVFAAVDPALAWRNERSDGDRLSPGDRVATVEGPLGSMLRGERVALNFLTHLSGVATATAAVLEAIKDSGCGLRDTRKTIPGLRLLEKYAVRMGGGVNHRLDLAAGVLIKDNHLAALRARLPAGADAIAEAVRLAREANPDKRIEVEVTTVAEARQALAAAAEELLLDNMPLDEMRQVVAIAAGHDPWPVLEASGGITLANALAVAETGVNFISMGAITHSAKALDMSLEVEAL